jgi:homoaconitase/3-isopropylmalate dehydratase large subunit
VLFWHVGVVENWAWSSGCDYDIGDKRDLVQDPTGCRDSIRWEPSIGTSGKDIILYILQQLKRNTVAADRVVEYTGPGLKHLSCNARFAIANMMTVSFRCV